MQELSAWSEGRSRNSTNKGLTPQISCLETQCTEEGFWSPRYFSNFESLTLNKMIVVDEKNRALAPRFSPLFPLLSGVTSQEEFEAWVRKINAKSSWDIWVWGFNIIGIPIGAFLQFIYTPLVLPAVAAWQLSLPPGAASPGTIHPQVIELVNLYNDLARNPRSACAYEYGGR